jgi:hypothetical protein
MIVPGFLIAIATFPGVIVHEAAHMLFCRLRGVAVLDACFFRFGNPAGYVVHEAPRDFLTAFLISVGPFFVNTLLCLVICFPAYVPTQVFGLASPLSYGLLWLGVSIGMHAFPSNQDGRELLRHARAAARGGNLLAILSFPLVGLIYAANLLSIFWLDYFYGLAVGIGLPRLLL